MIVWLYVVLKRSPKNVWGKCQIDPKSLRRCSFWLCFRYYLTAHLTLLHSDASLILFRITCTLFVIMSWLSRAVKFWHLLYLAFFLSFFLSFFFSFLCRLVKRKKKSIYVYIYCLIKSHCTTLIWKIGDLRITEKKLMRDESVAKVKNIMSFE